MKFSDFFKCFGVFAIMFFMLWLMIKVAGTIFKFTIGLAIGVLAAAF